MRQESQLSKALRNVSRLCDEAVVVEMQQQLTCVQRMSNANRILRRIATSSHLEQLYDCFAEVLLSLIFAGLGFAVEIEPHGAKGPDLQVTRDSCSATVEVTRFRFVYPGPPEVDISGEDEDMPFYGDMSRDIMKAFSKITAKFEQAQNGHAVIAIWNDDEDMGDPAVRLAVDQIQRDLARGRLAVPNRLLFVLYGSKWVSFGGKGKQLYCFPVRPTSPPYDCWQRDISASFVRELIWRVRGN